jgi:hypothetical protein
VPQHRGLKRILRISGRMSPPPNKGKYPVTIYTITIYHRPLFRRDRIAAGPWLLRPPSSPRRIFNRRSVHRGVSLHLATSTEKAAAANLRLQHQVAAREVLIAAQAEQSYERFVSQWKPRRPKAGARAPQLYSRQCMRLYWHPTVSGSRRRRRRSSDSAALLPSALLEETRKASEEIGLPHRSAFRQPSVALSNNPGGWSTMKIERSVSRPPISSHFILPSTSVVY